MDLWYSLYCREGALGVWETGQKCIKTKSTCQIQENARFVIKPYIAQKSQFAIHLRIKKLMQRQFSSKLFRVLVYLCWGSDQVLVELYGAITGLLPLENTFSQMENAKKSINKGP